MGRSNERFGRLRVPQIAGDDQDVQRHHRHHTKYNQVFHILRHFFSCAARGSSAFTRTLRSSQPGHGWPQRSQLQPATASVSRGVIVVGAISSNISSAGLFSSLDKKLVLIGAPFALRRYGRRWRMTRRLLRFPLQKLCTLADKNSVKRVPIHPDRGVKKI
jgi:hypothetical protein